MSDVAQFWTSIKAYLDAAVGRVRPLRVQAVSQAAGLLTIQRYENTTPDGEQYARLVGFVTNAGDEVICLNLDGTLLPLGTVQRAAGTGYALDAALTVAPTSGTGTLVLANTAANTGVELGTPATAETPYIDFHSGGSSTDYDARLIASGGTGTNGQGTLTHQAATHSFNGVLQATGTLDFPAQGLTSLNIDTALLLLNSIGTQSAASTTSANPTKSGALQFDLTLPTGTWNVILVGGAVLWNDTGSVCLWLTNNTTVATPATGGGTFPYIFTNSTSAAPRRYEAAGLLTGLSGLQHFFVSYATNGAGTANVENPFIAVFGRRTA